VINSHADQIVQLPEGGRVLGGNDHCPNSMLAVGDHILGLQGHPEFEAPYARRRMEYRRGRAIPPDVVDGALASLVEPPDRRLLADWMVEFLTR
jgi:GMP synthase (glutamine-hydrolysing)